jgi:predicted alpha/beta superfamily hydrolase
MNRFHLLVLSLTTLCSTTFAQQPAPIVIGHVDTLHSVALNENRVLNIYLPDGYSPDSAYPVIYLLDGALDEDFIHIAGLVQFLSFPWVSQVKPSILVGIANTDRKRDMTLKPSPDFVWPEWALAYKPAFTNAGGSAAFMTFIETELQPYIAHNYKTNGMKTLIGQSLAGLFAAEVLLKKPALFNNYIIMSPSLWWDNESLLKHAAASLRALPATPMQVYIAVGKEGKVMESDAKNLAKAIQKSGAKNVKLQFEYLPKEDHGTILHQAVGNAFEWMED